MAVLVGPDHIFSLANAAYRAMFGEHLIGKPVREALPDASPRLYATLDHVFQTGSTVAIPAVPVNCVARQVRSSFVDFTYSPVRDADGMVSAVSIHGADVTDYVVVQDELRANAAIALGTLDATPMAICLFDKFLIMRVVNQAALEMSGRKAADVANKHYSEIVGEEHFARRQAVLSSVLGGQEIAFDEEWHGRNGERRLFNYRFIPRWLNGEVVGFYLMTRDVTPRSAGLVH